MQVYFGLVALILLIHVAGLIACGAGADKRRVDRVNNVLIALGVFSVFALRSTSVGVDLGNYIATFSAGQALETRKMGVEIGYAALNDVVRLLTSDPHVFLAVVAALTILPVGWVIGKTSEGIYLSWILFITLGPFALMLSGLRQGIALAIVFATLPFLARRKVFIPLLLSIMAVAFHASALVFLPAVYFYRMRLTLRASLGVAAAVLAVAFFGEQLVTFVISNVYSTYEIVATGAYRWTLVNLAWWLVLLTLYRRSNARLPNYAGLYILVLVGVLVQALSAFGTNVSRGANYFLQFLAILTPNALSVLEDRRVGTLIAGSLGVAALAYFFLTADQSAYQIVPYKFMWEG